MRTGDLCRQFGVSETTVRRWAVEFSDFLSPVRGKQRHYTGDDFILMATIHQLSLEGLTIKAVRKKLQEGYRVEDSAAQSIGYSDGRQVPAAVMEQVIDSVELRTELEHVKAERDKLAQLLDNAHQHAAKWEQRYTEVLDQLTRLQARIAELEREAGQLSGELNYRRKLDPDGG